MNPSPSANQSTPSRVATSCSPTCHSPDFRNWTTATFQSPGDGADHHAERGARLALAVAGVDEHERPRGVQALGQVVLGGRLFAAGSVMSCLPGRSPYIARREVPPGIGHASRSAALLLFGCANPGYGSDSTRANLEHAGLTDEQARCVARGLERKFGIKRLERTPSRTATEFQRARSKCSTTATSTVSSDGAGSS